MHNLKQTEDVLRIPPVKEEKETFQMTETK